LTAGGSCRIIEKQTVLKGVVVTARTLSRRGILVDMRPANEVRSASALNRLLWMLLLAAVLAGPLAARETPSRIRCPCEWVCGTPGLLELKARGTSGWTNLARVIGREAAFQDTLDLGRYSVCFDWTGTDAPDTTETHHTYLGRSGRFVPDFVLAVGLACESSLVRLTETRFSFPPPLPSSRGRRMAYVADLPFPVAGIASGQTIGFDVAIPEGNLRNVAAHEIFHTIQFGYSTGAEPSWVFEGSAVYMEGATWDAWANYRLNGYKHIDGGHVEGFFEHPELSLGTYTYKSWHYGYYETFIFFKFLAEYLEDDAMMPRLWDLLESSGSGPGPRIWTAVEQLVREKFPGVEFSDIFAAFSMWNYTPAGKYREDGGEYATPEARHTETGYGPGRREDYLSYLSSHYLVFRPGYDYGDLVLKLELPEAGDLDRTAVTILREQQDGTWHADPWPGPESRADTVKGFGGSIRQVVVILTNTAHPRQASVSELERMEMLVPYALETVTDQDFVLSAAVPNPFSRSTELSVVPDRPGSAELEVFDVSGRRVWSSGVRRFEPREYRLSWDGLDSRGRDLPSGVYFLRLTFEWREEWLKVTKLN